MTDPTTQAFVTAVKAKTRSGNRMAEDTCRNKAKECRTCLETQYDRLEDVEKKRTMKRHLTIESFDGFKYSNPRGSISEVFGNDVRGLMLDKKYMTIEENLKAHRMAIRALIAEDSAPTSISNELFFDAQEQLSFEDDQDDTAIEIADGFLPEVSVNQPDLEDTKLADIDEATIGLAEIGEATSIPCIRGKAAMVQIDNVPAREYKSCALDTSS